MKKLHEHLRNQVLHAGVRLVHSRVFYNHDKLSARDAVSDVESLLLRNIDLGFYCQALDKAVAVMSARAREIGLIESSIEDIMDEAYIKDLLKPLVKECVMSALHGFVHRVTSALNPDNFWQHRRTSGVLAEIERICNSLED